MAELHNGIPHGPEGGLDLPWELCGVGAEPDLGRVSHPRAGTFPESLAGGEEGVEPVALPARLLVTFAFRTSLCAVG